MAHCYSCGADWSAGKYAQTCAECDGGAMQRPCYICGGRCGMLNLRAVSDSNDSGIGHWAGACKLPNELKNKQK